MTALKPLRVGGVPEHFNLPWLLAIESGDAGRSGFEVEWLEYTTGTGAMLSELVDGGLDLAVLLTEGVAFGLAHDLPISAVSLYTLSPLIWGIHVPAASASQSLADLEGARFGISRHGSGSHLMSIALALRESWSVDRLDFVVVDNLPGAIDAFERDRADVFLWEHFTTQPAVDARHFRRIGDFVAPWPAWVLCANRKFLEDSAPAVDDLIGIVAGQAAALTAAEDAANQIAARFGLEEAAVADWLTRTCWVAGKTSPLEAIALADEMLRQAKAI